MSLNAAAETEESVDIGKPQNFTKKRKQGKQHNKKNTKKAEDLHDLQLHVLRLLGRLGG
mgnify:CR=1